MRGRRSPDAGRRFERSLGEADALSRAPEINRREEKPGQDCQMPGQSQVRARAAEAAAGNVDAVNSRPGRGTEEGQEQSDGDGQRTREKAVQDQRKPANQFQPGQVKSKTHSDRPGNHLIITDVACEMYRIARLQESGVNENSTNDNGENPLEDFGTRQSGHSISCSPILPSRLAERRYS